MTNIDERIESLETKLKQLKTLQQRREARARSAALKRARSEELRKKILVGTVLLAKIEAGEFDDTVLRRWMDAALSRPEDRELFELPVRE